VQVRLRHHLLDPRKLLVTIAVIPEKYRLKERTHVQPTRVPVSGLDVSEPLIDRKARNGSRVGRTLEDGVQEIPVGVVARRIGMPPLSIPPGLIPPGARQLVAAARAVLVLDTDAPANSGCSGLRARALP
jgi:hypothetical protein